MTTHKRDNQHGVMPLCWRGVDKGVVAKVEVFVDNIDCVDCLRMLVKDAVLFGNGRRARRS